LLGHFGACQVFSARGIAPLASPRYAPICQGMFGKATVLRLDLHGAFDTEL